MNQNLERVTAIFHGVLNEQNSGHFITKRGFIALGDEMPTVVELRTAIALIRATFPQVPPFEPRRNDEHRAA